MYSNLTFITVIKFKPEFQDLTRQVYKLFREPVEQPLWVLALQKKKSYSFKNQTG